MRWIDSLPECARWRVDVLALVIAGLVALFGTTPAHAQRVVGVLRDSATDEPIRGAVLTVTDANGGFLARSVGDTAGRFAVPRLRGSARLQVMRIGYRPRTIALSSHADDSVVVLRMQPFVAMMEGVAATATRVCLRDSTRVDALMLWDQARAALLAGVIARQQDPPSVRLYSHVVRRDAVTRRIEWDSANVKDVVVQRSFVAARPAWVFASQGYMRETVGGGRTYYAPDEETLLDSSFAETHCLRAVYADRTHPAEIGIGFAPVRTDGRDTLVDVQGVVWLDRASPRIRSVEYTYTGLERDARGAGGELYFFTTPRGVPMVDHWIIHTPLVVDDPEPSVTGTPRSLPPRPERIDVRVLGYLETGGEVISARWSDGSEWHGSHPRIVGTIKDVHGLPMAAQRVWLNGWPDTTTSGAGGRFELPYVVPGIFTVSASDSVLARHGLSRTPQLAVLLQTGGTDGVVNLVEYSREDALSLVCPTRSYRAGTGVIMGRVVGPGDQPIAAARIEMLEAPANDSLDARPHAARSDDNGKFVVCGASLASPLRLRATKDDLAGDARVDRWTDGVVELTIVLRKAE